MNLKNIIYGIVLASGLGGCAMNSATITPHLSSTKIATDTIAARLEDLQIKTPFLGDMYSLRHQVVPLEVYLCSENLMKPLLTRVTNWPKTSVPNYNHLNSE